jgi:lipoprotein signal peptidase
MKRFLGNLTWIIFALPFYVTSLLMCAYAFIILTAIGIVFDKTKPYNMVDKIDSYIYKQVKEYLIG